jgi:hypothetical protein
MTRETKLETTLGDLVVALTEETGRYVRDEKTTYEVVAYILYSRKLSQRLQRSLKSAALTVSG